MRFIRLVFVVWLLLVALTGGLTIFRRAQPVTDELQTLGYCDGQPCYLSITPRKSTWEDAKRILTGISGSTVSSTFMDVEAPGGTIPTVKVDTYQGGTVSEVISHFHEGTVPLSSVLIRLGVPCAVYPIRYSYARPYAITLLYPQATVYVDTKNDGLRLEPASSILQIVFGGLSWTTRGPANDHAVDRCQGADGAVKYAWKGLRSYPRQ
jgi:hypothetical protein